MLGNIFTGKVIYMEISSFIRFFTKIHKLLFASLFFTIPLVVFTGVFALIGLLTGFNNTILWLLGLIPAYPFYSGFVMIVRKYAVEKLDSQMSNDDLQLFLLHMWSSDAVF